MAELPPDGSKDDPGMTPDRDPTIGTPRWVKVFAIIAGAVIVLLVILALTGRGDHGPGRHRGGDRGHTPPMQHGP